MMKNGYILNIMISVIVPYNKDRGFLKQCIESVESQDYMHEIIPVYSDSSVAVNFNKGLKQASGEFVKFVCEDDFLPPGALQLLAEGIDYLDWICANAIQVTYENWIYKPGNYSDDFLSLKGNLEMNRIHGGTTLYRTEILKSIGGMNEKLWTGEEYDMHLKLMSLGHMPGYIDKEVYCHRIWGGQKSRVLRKNYKNERQKEIDRIQSLYSNKI